MLRRRGHKVTSCRGRDVRENHRLPSDQPPVDSCEWHSGDRCRAQSAISDPVAPNIQPTDGFDFKLDLWWFPPTAQYRETGAGFILKGSTVFKVYRWMRLL